LLLPTTAKVSYPFDSIVEVNFSFTNVFSAEIVKLLLKRKANVNARDKEGATALHKAAYVGEASLVAVLVKHGADVNAKDNEGATPLHKVTYPQTSSILLILINIGLFQWNGRLRLSFTGCWS
jgi:hypothetical protein